MAKVKAKPKTKARPKTNEKLLTGTDYPFDEFKRDCNVCEMLWQQIQGIALAKDLGPAKAYEKIAKVLKAQVEKIKRKYPGSDAEVSAWPELLESAGKTIL